MSNSSESGSDKAELDLDLLLLPAWAQKPPEVNKYAKYEGGEAEHGSRRPTRGNRRDEPRGRPAFRREGRDAIRGEKRPPPPRGRPRPDERREQPAPRIEINVAFIPEEKGVESLARQIRLTGRAYPLFEIAVLILKKPDRYHVRFGVIKDAEGKVCQPLFVCALDETLWLSEQDAVDHALTRHFATFYQTERVPTDPPKGTYTFVAQCGMSGTILGPPNYHDYQNKLRKLHSERFAHVPFDVFKARIRIVRDEAIVKKWVEEQSWKTQFVCLNVPESPKLCSREEVAKHFREIHLPNVIKAVETCTLTGLGAHALPERALQNLVRRALDDQLRFPLRVVNVLSQQFAGHGLQFFKVNRTVTHVAVARPHYLDLDATPVSEGIKRIVDSINSTPNCTRRKLLELLLPGTQVSTAGTKDEKTPIDALAPSPEAEAIISDLHWLIHQGHVIEFSNGVLETAKRPAPRPAKPESPSAAVSETAASGGTPDQPVSAVSAQDRPTPEGEATVETMTESAPNIPMAARPDSGESLDEAASSEAASAANPDLTQSSVPVVTANASAEPST